MNRIRRGRIKYVSVFLAAILLAGSFFAVPANAAQPVSTGDVEEIREPEVSEGDSEVMQEPEAESEEETPAEYSIAQTSEPLAKLGSAGSSGALILTSEQLKFVKKKTSVYAGQRDVFAGRIKYSTEEDYVLNFTAAAYDKRGGVQNDINCTIRNENELYLSVGAYVAPGSYKVVIYAGNGETMTGAPQAGSLYQANTSFTLTVKEGIYYLDTSGITSQIAVNGKKVTFSAVPKGMGYNGKTEKQKFTYEIKTAVPKESGYAITTSSSKVSNNITVNSSGKVTIKPGYTVDTDTSKNYFAIVIKAADYAENETTATVYVQVTSTALVPTQIYLTSGSGVKFGNNIFADRANGANIVVLDQNGNNISQYVKITPADDAKHTKGAYVSRSGSGAAYLCVRKPGTYTVKATTKDERKKSKSVKITVFPPEDAEMIYSLYGVTCGGLDAGSATAEGGTVTYSAPKGAAIKMVAGGKIDGVDYWNSRWFKWKYSITGGSRKTDGDFWLITPTAQTCELTVWTEKHPDKAWTIKFVNKAWDSASDPAPGLTRTGGKLYSNRYTHPSDLEYYYNEYYGREEYEVPDQQLIYLYDYGVYDSVDIAPVSKSAPTLKISDFDPAQRTFRLNLSPGNDIKAGSYKYKIGFYKGGLMMCRPATVTVKVNASSAVKLTASYTLKLSQADSVIIKSTPTGFMPDYDKALLNANEGGRANDFNKYFELVYLTDPAGVKSAAIKLKDSVTEEERESLKGRKLTGYVRYSYFYGYSYMKNKTTKVTIKIK